MIKRYIFIAFFILIVSLIFWDRWQMRSEQKTFKIDTEYQEEKFIQAEQLIDSMIVTFDNVKTYTQVDTVFISIPSNSNSPKKNVTIKKVEEPNVEAKEIVMIKQPDNQRLIDEYENTIHFLQLEIQRLRYYIDSLESKNN
jgi:FtsZ-interacting cell division protein ZipA